MTEHPLFSLMVIAAATDVAVLNGRRGRHGLWAIGAIEIAAQDRGEGGPLKEGLPNGPRLESGETAFNLTEKRLHHHGHTICRT
jgi:hypothetical protein